MTQPTIIPRAATVLNAQRGICMKIKLIYKFSHSIEEGRLIRAELTNGEIVPYDYISIWYITIGIRQP